MWTYVLHERSIAVMRAVATLRAFARASAVATILLSACHGGSDHGPRVIVSNENDDTVTVIDARSREVVSTIAVGKRPRGMRVDGSTLYVALSGSPKGGPGVDESMLPPPNRRADGIGVVDLDSGKLVRTLESGSDPESFDLARGDLLVVSNEDAGNASFVDTSSHKVVGQVKVGGEPEGVTTAPGGLVWVTSEADGTVSVIDPVARSVVAAVAVGKRPRSIAFTPDGATAVVPNEADGSVTVLDAHTHTVRRTIAIPHEGSSPAGPRPMGVAVSADGHAAYVTTGRGKSVAVIDLDTGKVAGVLSDVGARPWGIAIGGDGLVYTANGSSNDVSVIDPTTRTVVQHIPVGGSPWGVVVTR
jgi:YVTN family beta-propeller protein